MDLSQGYDYNALIQAAPDGTNGYDARYGMADLFNDGTRAYVSLKYQFQETTAPAPARPGGFVPPGRFFLGGETTRPPRVDRARPR